MKSDRPNEVKKKERLKKLSRMDAAVAAEALSNEKRSATQHSRLGMEQKQPPEKWRRIAARLNSAWTGLLAIVTLFAAWPRVGVVAGIPVDSQNALSASFEIMNSGFAPLTKVDVSMGLIFMKFENGMTWKVDPRSTTDPKLGTPSWSARYFAPDDHFTISLVEVAGGMFLDYGPIKQGDIYIIVSYQPWGLPFHYEKKFRFTTFKQLDGKFYWYSRPTE
jgi:hypothetical protein